MGWQSIAYDRFVGCLQWISDAVHHIHLRLDFGYGFCLCLGSDLFVVVSCQSLGASGIVCGNSSETSKGPAIDSDCSGLHRNPIHNALGFQSRPCLTTIASGADANERRNG